MKSQFRISLVNGPKLDQALCQVCEGSFYALEHSTDPKQMAEVENPHTFKPAWVEAKSVRKSRAIKEARRLAVGNGNVMLWGKNQETGQWYRISVRKSPDSTWPKGSVGNPHNAVQVGASV